MFSKQQNQTQETAIIYFPSADSMDAMNELNKNLEELDGGIIFSSQEAEKKFGEIPINGSPWTIQVARSKDQVEALVAERNFKELAKHIIKINDKPVTFNGDRFEDCAKKPGPG